MLTYHFPIKDVRSKFPALSRKVNSQSLIYFDGPGGTQMVEDASNGMMSYISNGMANLHGPFITSEETEQVIDETRKAVADLLHCQEKEVAFGQNMTSLAFAISRSLATYINPGGEIVVTELDHHANVDPWVTLAKDRNATSNYIKLNPETLSLDLENLDKVITSKTKLVAVGLSSNVTGTVTDIHPIITRAKEVGAIVVVDAVHAVPHIPIDFKKWDCDILLCSAYKFFGPHLGIAVIREALFEKTSFYKINPAPTEAPYKLETGTQNHEAIAGLNGAISFIENLGQGASRRERITSGIERIEAHENILAEQLETFLRGIPKLTLYRANNEVRKTPTFAFTLEDHHSKKIAQSLFLDYKMCVAYGDFYASTMAERLDVNQKGGWVRIGLAPYNTLEEIQLFKEGLQKLI